MIINNRSTVGWATDCKIGTGWCSSSVGSYFFFPTNKIFRTFPCYHDLLSCITWMKYCTLGAKDNTYLYNFLSFIFSQADKAVAEEKLEAARPALEEAEAALQVSELVDFFVFFFISSRVCLTASLTLFTRPSKPAISPRSGSFLNRPIWSCALWTAFWSCFERGLIQRRLMLRGTVWSHHGPSHWR